MPMLNNYSRGDGEMDLVATHQRLLIGAVMRTTGPILELGVGWYSTPLLHEIAEAQKRLVVTADNNPHWLAQFKPLASKYHEFHDVGWWGDFYPLIAHGTLRTNRWSVCLVDQGQPIEREYAIRKLIDSVGVFVMHDTEEGFAYGYDRLLGTRRYSPVAEHMAYDKGMFKYLYTDRCQETWTTVASNTVDVSQWFMDLPPVEPTEEVT